MGDAIEIKDREFLNLEEASAWMGVSEKTLMAWREEGLEYYRKGRRVFYSKALLTAFMERYRQ